MKFLADHALDPALAPKLSFAGDTAILTMQQFCPEQRLQGVLGYVLKDLLLRGLLANIPNLPAVAILPCELSNGFQLEISLPDALHGPLCHSINSNKDLITAVIPALLGQLLLRDFPGRQKQFPKLGLFQLPGKGTMNCWLDEGQIFHVHIFWLAVGSHTSISPCGLCYPTAFAEATNRRWLQHNFPS